ncbi:hypothetical protein ACFYUV_20845 [Nonomuraea sp. NPDC003560]|uniref:hypothetical protein n=1 Tax=Nonomuraea sp. NPDC003560 TaxID=3364341 RepID=UPI0036938F72
MSESTELERRQVSLGAPLTDLDDAYRLSKALAMAALMPDAVRGKPSDVLALLLYGQDLGLSPMQAIQGIYVVKGKPQLSGTTWISLARKAGHRVRIIESTDERCTVEIVRADDPSSPHRETFTLQDAARAGLCAIKDGKAHARSSKGDPLPWESYTRTMLRNRAISNCAKFACPEVALGFGVEGDYDYIADAVVEVTQPEVVEAETVVDPEKVAEEIGNLAEEFNFADTVDAEVVEGPSEDYRCETCGLVGDHFEDECPGGSRA